MLNIEKFEAEEEKPMSCLFCGGECKTDELLKCFAVCCTKCAYITNHYRKESDAIAEHNKRCKAWLAYKDSEVK